MPTYRNINQHEDSQEAGSIFKKIQKWINDRGFFGKELNTNADERILTGYEKTAGTKNIDLYSASQSIEDKLNKDYDVHLIEKYREFETMEKVSEVASALDLIADECVQLGDNDHVVQIYSPNEKVKKELENLFFRILKIDNDCWDKVRTMIQYGNRFEEAVINKNDPGILYLNYIDPASIRRNEFKGRLVNFSKVEYKDQTLQVTTYPTKDENKKQNVLQAFRVIHYRIEDSRFQPYGKSVLESSRRTVRQLNMMEDAMTTYRYSRASEKRVWNVDCGDLGPDEAMKYTEEVRDKLRKKPRFNPQTGAYDYEMNPLSITEDFFMPIRNGFTNNSVQQLSGAQNLGEIDDVLYFKKKLFFAMKIPLAFIGEEGLSYAKSNLALLDIRFARMIERIQRFFVKGLEKVAIIHLLLKKFKAEEISGFKINLTPASNIKKITDMDFMMAKFNAMSTAKQLEMFPDMWIMTVLYGLPEDEAENLLKMFKIQKAGGETQPGAEGGMMGGAPMGAEEMGLGPEPTPPGEEGGGMPEVPGAEVPGGEGGEAMPGEPPAGAGGTGGGAPLTASVKAELLIKNPFALRLYEEMQIDPKRKFEIYEQYRTCMETLSKHRKRDKKIEEKKDNITNSLKEFKIFGELEGIDQYISNSEKELFENRKLRRLKETKSGTK